METALWTHPAYPAIALDDELRVAVERLSRTSLRLRYVVSGRIEQLVTPPPAPPLRTDNLWRSTCFEAFLAAEGSPDYLELNFAPSSQWAAYHFSNYRTGMVQATLPVPPDIQVERRADRLAACVTLSLDLPREPCRLGLAAVIEECGGTKSYWALAHPSEAPDFHRRDCFVLELPAAEPS